MKHLLNRAIALVCALILVLLPLFPVSVAASPVGGGQASPSSTIKAYGCDMSFWNVGGYYPDYSRVDFEKMKADGCDYVILRVGFEGTASRQNTIDDAFLTLYTQAKNAGLDVGVYFYALATTYDGAAEDAAWCIDLFKQYNLSFEYPIYYDIEDPGNGADRPGHDTLTADEMTQLCLGWAQTLEAAGYYPGIYSGYETIMKLKAAYTDHYDIWYAYVAYVEGIPEFIPEEQDHSTFCGMWQYSWKGSFDGVVGDLDVNVAYKDYPTIMRTHGYNNVTPVWTNTLSSMPTPEGLALYEYNPLGEGIAPSYHQDGTVTFTNTVSDSSWSWPSAYMTCRTMIDLQRYPFFTIQKSGTAHFNAVLQYTTEDGSFHSLNLAALAEQQSGEFDSGDMTIRVDIAAALRRLGHTPQNNMLPVIGVYYFMMGAQNTTVTLQTAAFTTAPIPDTLTSVTYVIDDRFIANVSSPMTVQAFLLGLDNANSVTVRDTHGAALQDTDTIASGMTVSITKDGSPVKTYTLALLGDVNGDGAASTSDARIVLSTLTSTNILTDCQTRSADFDQNGSVTTSDVRDLLASVLI